MLVKKILKEDFLRNKVISIVVFVFILLSALLVASGSSLIFDLSSSLDALFKRAKVPQYTSVLFQKLGTINLEAYLFRGQILHTISSTPVRQGHRSGCLAGLTFLLECGHNLWPLPCRARTARDMFL